MLVATNQLNLGNPQIQVGFEAFHEQPPEAGNQPITQPGKFQNSFRIYDVCVKFRQLVLKYMGLWM